MTKINLSDFRNKLQEAKYWNSSGDDKTKCIRELISALENLANSISNHYHYGPEDHSSND